MENISPSVLPNIADRYALELLVLFGSRAAGGALPVSDFDIAYLSSRPLSLDEESRLIIDLSRAVGSENIDLVNARIAPPLLLYAIVRDGRLLYARNSMLFPQFAAYVLKRYAETKSLRDLRHRRLEKILNP